MSCPGFGEVNIPSSRAFWDDCDEDEYVENKEVELLQLKFEAEQTETPIASDLMLLVEGVHIIEFAEKTLLNSGAVKICAIPLGKKSALYNLKEQNMLLAILEEDLTTSGEVTELLLPYAKLAKNVITLNIKSKIDYKSENYAKVKDEITFLRGINADPKLQYVEDLETPNFIVGVAAGVASWRDGEELPISSYVAYTDTMMLDTLSAQKILKLLRDLDIKCATTYKPKLRDDSHLYL